MFTDRSVSGAKASRPQLDAADRQKGVGDVSDHETCPGECLEHREHVYILCYGRPVMVRDRDYLPDDLTRGYPITHYVGWTSQLPPVKRVRQHGAKSAHYVAEIRPGTTHDEAHAKRFEPCPKCGQSLWYYAESPTYSEEFVHHAAPGQAPRPQRPRQSAAMRAAEGRTLAGQVRA